MREERTHWRYGRRDCDCSGVSVNYLEFASRLTILDNQIHFNQMESKYGRIDQTMDSGVGYHACAPIQYEWRRPS